MARRQATESGQTGMMSDHDKDEYNLLMQICTAKEQLLEAKEAEKTEKDFLDNIKAVQLNDAIYAKAMKTEPMKRAFIAELNRRKKKIQVRYEAIKAANKSFSDDQIVAKLSDEDKAVLAQITKAKKDGLLQSATDKDSEDDDDGVNKGGRKKGTVIESIGNVQSMGREIVEAFQKPTALELQMAEYFRAKTKSARAVDQSLEQRLHNLQEANDCGTITKEEYRTLRAQILKEHF
jgi:hypothetical protein